MPGKPETQKLFPKCPREEEDDGGGDRSSGRQFTFQDSPESREAVSVSFHDCRLKKHEARQLCKSTCYISMHAHVHISHAVPSAAGVMAWVQLARRAAVTSSRFLPAGNSSLVPPGGTGRALLLFPALDWVSVACLTLPSAAHTALVRHHQGV